MRKKIFVLFLIVLITLCLSGCGTTDDMKDSDSNKKEETTVESKNKGTIMENDELITITYYDKELYGQYPAVLFNIKNNSDKDISIEPLGVLNGQDMTGRFIITNSDGKWASPNIVFKAGESYDTYFGYMDNYSREQLSLEKYVDMDLSFNVSEKNEYGGWNLIKKYTVHID